MKKYAKLATLLVSVLLITAGSTMAMPFSSSGFVNPNFNNSWNAADLTGTARFKFTIDEDWPQVTSVYIEFENDIFNLDELGVSDFTVQNPGGWSTSIFASSIGYAFSVSSPSTAGAIATAANDPIIIDVAFTLRDAAMFNQAEEEIPDGGGWAWDEGQAWGLAYTLRGPICLN
ncbi:MAG: hypothetical protein HKP58_01635, partial [Desulfatitalea sp.]|nr:hypothetical protein [Desulfatitalea sp.]NNJ99089.1 hypothetical protein [Desulfatitalea sp.]